MSYAEFEDAMIKAGWDEKEVESQWQVYSASSCYETYDTWDAPDWDRD